jgi:hypothetical protein
MGNAARAAERVADRMARAHVDGRHPARHREPHRELALEPRIEIGRVSLHARKRLGEQRDRLKEVAVARGIRTG